MFQLAFAVSSAINVTACLSENGQNPPARSYSEKVLGRPMGAPDYPTPSAVLDLQEASQLFWEPQELRTKENLMTMDITLQPQSVTVIELCRTGEPR